MTNSVRMRGKPNRCSTNGRASYHRLSTTWRAKFCWK